MASLRENGGRKLTGRFLCQPFPKGDQRRIGSALLGIDKVVAMKTCRFRYRRRSKHTRLQFIGDEQGGKKRQAEAMSGRLDQHLELVEHHAMDAFRRRAMMLEPP